MLLPLPTLEAQSASPSALAPAVAAAKELPRLHSLLVAQRGTIIRSALLQRPTRDDARERQVGVQERHLRTRRHRGRSHALRSAIQSRSTLPICRSRSATITIAQLLTMQSGLESTSNRNYGAWVQSPNWVRHALAKPLLAAPGHADDLQHRQYAHPLGGSHEGDRQEHVAVRAGVAGEAARLLAAAMAARSAGDLLRRQRDGDDAAPDAGLRR